LLNLVCSSPSTVIFSPLPMRGKQRFISILLVVIAISLLLMGYNLPQPHANRSLFEMQTMPTPFLLAAAIIITCGFLLLIAHWYDDGSHPLDPTVAFTTLLGGGLLTLLIADTVLYPAWHAATLMAANDNTLLRWIGSGMAAMEHINGDAGPVEELAKLLALLLIPSVRASISDGKTGALYAILCAFGFAMLENFSYFSDDASALWWRINPAHAVFSCIWGYALGAWMANALSTTRFILSLLAAMALHTTWNLMASSYPLLFVALFVLVCSLGLWLIRRMLGKDH